MQTTETTSTLETFGPFTADPPAAPLLCACDDTVRHTVAEHVERLITDAEARATRAARATQADLDRAALLTLDAVARAMRVRNLDAAGAVALVAERTGATVDEVLALVQRGGLAAFAACRGEL